MGWSALIFNEYCYVYRSLYPVKVTDEDRARQSSLMQVSLKTQNEIQNWWRESGSTPDVHKIKLLRDLIDTVGDLLGRHLEQLSV